uniref:Uncharacterized protein n=1 Tax=Aegilops tauschii subsp. strangulata TaxID=200361 RepID=A0A453DX84_AEGTS
MKEVSMAMAKINEAATAGSTVDMSELLNSFSNDMACRIVSGKFFLKDGRSKLFRELIRLLGGFNLEEYFPALGRVGVLKRVVCTKAERVRNRWADLLDKVIDDRVSKRKSASDHKDGDFVDILLSVQQEYNLTREHMKALLIDVFFGATDTSANVLEFTLAELMRRPHFMGKLQDEVRSIVPRGQEIVSETELNNMVYLRAVIKESLRLYPIAPLLAPHLAWLTVPSTDTWFLQGRVSSSMHGPLGGIRAPGRMLKSSYLKDLQMKGNDFQFLPFGAGRRICPGINLGIANVELMLANIMNHFDWELPIGVERKDIDMTEVFGISIRRKEKLLLI